MWLTLGVTLLHAALHVILCHMWSSLLGITMAGRIDFNIGVTYSS